MSSCAHFSWFFFPTPSLAPCDCEPRRGRRTYASAAVSSSCFASSPSVSTSHGTGSVEYSGAVPCRVACCCCVAVLGASTAALHAGLSDDHPAGRSLSHAPVLDRCLRIGTAARRTGHVAAAAPPVIQFLPSSVAFPTSNEQPTNSMDARRTGRSSDN